jgi:hypothetical protein
MSFQYMLFFPCLQLNRVGNGNDDISSEEHIKNSKTSRGSLFWPITSYFCLNIEFYLVTQSLKVFCRGVVDLNYTMQKNVLFSSSCSLGAVKTKFVIFRSGTCGKHYIFKNIKSVALTQKHYTI